MARAESSECAISSVQEGAEPTKIANRAYYRRRTRGAVFMDDFTLGLFTKTRSSHARLNVPALVQVAAFAIILIRGLDLLMILNQLGVQGIADFVHRSVQTWALTLVFLASLALVFIEIWCAFSLVKGRNWARWLYLLTQIIVISYLWAASIGYGYPELFSVAGESKREILHALFCKSCRICWCWRYCLSRRRADGFPLAITVLQSRPGFLEGLLMHCALYDAGRCRSCQWLELPLMQQLADKMANLRELLAGHPAARWLAPVSGPETAFRNKAKMVVSGSVERPLLGMLHRDGTPEDLTDCPLYPPSFEPVFAALKPFIARAGLTYNVARKRGELKYLLLTESQQGGMMLRFVLRSAAKLAQLRAALPWLQQQLPQLKVITANIQPVHMAIMEGEQEIFLSDQQALAENFNGVPLWIRPQSFPDQPDGGEPALCYRPRLGTRAAGQPHVGSVLRRRRFRPALRNPQMRLTGIEIARKPSPARSNPRPNWD